MEEKYLKEISVSLKEIAAGATNPMELILALNKINTNLEKIVDNTHNLIVAINSSK